MSALILLLGAVGSGVYALYRFNIERFMELEQDVDEA